jgi:hypothetical protein
MKYLWLAAVSIAALVTACAGSETDDTGNDTAAACGPATCATDEYCCDAKCGLCVEMEVACNMTCE